MTKAACLTGLLALIAVGCGDDGGGEGEGGSTAGDSTTNSAEGTTMTPEPGTSSGGGAETTTDADSSGGDSTGPELTDDGGSSSSTGNPDDGVITFDEIAPIFQTKCLPCHGAGTFGGHNIGDDDVLAGYEDSQLDANIATCNGLSKGACALVRIQDGSMPMGFGCSGDPTMDDEEFCLTQQEQDRIQTWIDDGELAPL